MATRDDRVTKLQIFSSNLVSEELVLRSLGASPFINMFFPRLERDRKCSACIETFQSV